MLLLLVNKYRIFQQLYAKISSEQLPNFNQASIFSKLSNVAKQPYTWTHIAVGLLHICDDTPPLTLS